MNGALVRWKGRAITVRASFGIEVFDADSDPTAIVGRADAAMYRAKNAELNPKTPDNAEAA